MSVAHHLEAVVAVQAVGGANPDEAQRVLRDGVDGRVRQAGVHGEVLEHDLVRRRRRGAERNGAVGALRERGERLPQNQRQDHGQHSGQDHGQNRRGGQDRGYAVSHAASTKRSISAAISGGTDEKRICNRSPSWPTALA